MSDRAEFERTFPVPEGIGWIDGRQGYRIISDDDCWFDSDGQAAYREYQARWAGWQAYRAQSGQGVEPVIPGDPLPCPFCGSTDVGGASGTVGCYRCPAEIAVQNANTAYAVELWNNRVANQPQPAQQWSVPEPFAYHCIRGGKDCFSRSLREGDAALWQMSGAAITPLFKNATPQPVGDGWIRCSDRLPAEADADCYGTIVGWDSIHDQAITIYPMAAKHRKGITHWKPTGLKRPQPPKEGGADEH